MLKPETLRALLEEVASGTKSINEAVIQLSDLPFEDLGYATIDHHRELRTGFPEIVYGSGKTAEQIAGVVRAIVQRGQAALVTRVDEPLSERVMSLLEEPIVSSASFESLSIAQKTSRSTDKARSTSL